MDATDRDKGILHSCRIARFHSCKHAPNATTNATKMQYSEMLEKQQVSTWIQQCDKCDKFEFLTEA